MTLGRRSGCSALLLGAVLLGYPAPAQQYGGRSWRISEFSDNIQVNADGSAEISERINLVFIGHWNGIRRYIPIQYPAPTGTNYSLFVKITGITDADGHDLKHEISTSGAYRNIKIYIPSAEDTNKKIYINYAVRNAVRFFDDPDGHDEFYWNVTGNDWTVPIDSATAYVTFPQESAGKLKAQAFTGVYGGRSQEATATIEGSKVRFETTNPLSMREGLTIDVYLPKGILREPGAMTKTAWFVSSNPIVFLPLLAFAVMFTMWWLKGRDPDPGESVAPMYEPPQGMTPAEVGALVEDKVIPRDITSTLIDLAVRGYIHIKEIIETQLMFFHHKDYELTLVKPRQQWQGLAPHEQVMLDNVFASGDITRVSALRNHFYTAVPTIRQDVIGALKEKGMYTLDPDNAHGYAIVGAIIVAAPFLLLGYFGHVNFFASGWLFFVSIALALAIVVLFGLIMTAKSLLGVRTRVHILGFQEFMTRVDSDRLKRMPSDTFERFLPYAMALGVEQRWAKAFAGIVKDPPSWYSGGQPGMYFDPFYFTNSVRVMSNEAGSAFVAAPRAESSGSGFSSGGFSSGGGFSGGGFGGGGGDAF